MNSHTTEQLLMCEKADLVKYIQELKGENEELKEHNEMFDEDITYKMNELKELKKQVKVSEDIVEKFSIYCEILDENADGWEDMIDGSQGYMRNDEGDIVSR